MRHHHPYDPAIAERKQKNRNIFAETMRICRRGGYVTPSGAEVRLSGTDEVLNFEVSGDKIEAVHMLPGYTHNIINLSQTENLVTLMWANEQFDPSKPDTYFEVV